MHTEDMVVLLHVFRDYRYTVDSNKISADNLGERLWGHYSCVVSIIKFVPRTNTDLLISVRTVHPAWLITCSYF